MNLLLAATAALALALAGTGLLRGCWPAILEIPRPARLALGYCVGCWLVTLIFFGAYLLGISFSRLLLLTPMLLLAVPGAATMIAGGNWQRPAWLAAALPAMLCLLALALSWGRPVYGYDAVMMWALKAKMAFFARTWPPTMFDPFTTAHTDYPPLVPSAQTFVFFWLEDFDDVASRVVFAGFFAAGAVLLWWLLGHLRPSGRWVWVTWWCAWPVVMEQVKLSYADLPVAVYLVVFYGAVVAWLREPDQREWLWLAGLFGGMAFWVKQDALIGIGAGLVALLVSVGMRKMPWGPVALAAGLALPWRAFVWARDFPSDFALRLTAVPLKVVQVAEALWRFGVVGGGFAFLGLVFVLALVIGQRQLRRPEIVWLLVSVVIGLAGVFTVYLFSTANLPALLETSLERVLLNLALPALLLVALIWPETPVMRRVLMVAVVGLGLWAAYRNTREWIDLRREFGGKTLAQQRVQAVEPALRREIARALNEYPPGTHVQVLPKRSLGRHRFYYETYPDLIVDNSATNVITLPVP